MKLSKEERHEVYIRALYHYRSGMRILGLCNALEMALRELDFATWGYGKIKYELDPYMHMECYPEIEKHKPEGHRRELWWWPIGDRARRINILEQAIEETKLIKETI